MRLKKMLGIKLIIFTILATNLQVFTANAGGGCGSTTPEISRSLVKPGETFTVDYSFIHYDSDINYADVSIAPEVNFSSSIVFLRKKMEFRSLDSNKWALFRATFQVPNDFVGNQNLQAVIIHPRCGGKTKDITYGPYLTIQSSNDIPTCTIEELQVNDYSVRSGEPFKVGFKVISSLQDLKPIIELTDYLGIKTFTPRLAGASGSDVKVYEATLTYSENYQYPYGAIARAEVKGFCNSSGRRQIIGTLGYVTSQAMIQPTYPGSVCEIEGSKIITNTEQATSEELLCVRDSQRGKSLNWMNDAMIEKISPKSSTFEPCQKIFATKTAMSQKFFCVMLENQMVWAVEKNINLSMWQELKSIQDAKSKSLNNLVLKAKKSNPAKVSAIESLWSEYNQSISNVPSSMQDTVQEFIFIDTQFDTYLQRLNSLISTVDKEAPPQNKIFSITCTKGKVIKKVTGIAPKCPNGYKKK